MDKLFPCFLLLLYLVQYSDTFTLRFCGHVAVD